VVEQLMLLVVPVVVQMVQLAPHPLELEEVEHRNFLEEMAGLDGPDLVR
jgi:hypothetical protein